MELLLNTHMMILDIRRTIAGHEGTDKGDLPVSGTPARRKKNADRFPEPTWVSSCGSLGVRDPTPVQSFSG